MQILSFIAWVLVVIIFGGLALALLNVIVLVALFVVAIAVIGFIFKVIMIFGGL